MRNLGRFALTIGAAVLFTGCGGSQPPIGAPGVPTLQRSLVHHAYRVLYSFNGGSGSAESPYAGLVNVNGTLYGTTVHGGEYCRQGGSSGCGTAFSITPSGTETILHSFGSSGDGVDPEAGLLNVNGTLYGTTFFGGANDEGTVFSVTLSGTEAVFYSFKGGLEDGAYPKAGLINVNGTLYGTTTEGGDYGYGTVFAITKSGSEAVFHSFGSSGDGAVPEAALINVSGTLYGTTISGGANDNGTVFAISKLGTETIYSFGPYPLRNGSGPNASLVSVKGRLYGTTLYGGTKNTGTVFSITPSGIFNVLYSFKRGRGDGAHPLAGLLSVNGTLYSTTSAGGASLYGTIFSVTPSGAETVLYSFKGPYSGDGAVPVAGLINVKGVLYGTTTSGGANGNVYGTVFSLSP